MIIKVKYIEYWNGKPKKISLQRDSDNREIHSILEIGNDEEIGRLIKIFESVPAIIEETTPIQVNDELVYDEKTQRLTIIKPQPIEGEIIPAG